MRGCGVRMRRKRRCLGMKKVLGRSGLMLRCHDATNVRGRERRKERETIKKVPSSCISRYIELKVRMHENA